MRRLGLLKLMAVVFIGVGSNIGPDVNIPRGLRLLTQYCRLTGISTFYQTRALGRDDVPDFVNGVLRAETDILPRHLKYGVLRTIEDRLGRHRTPDPCQPRTIDLDILLYDDLVVSEPDMVIPDRHILDRAFVAIPVLEVWPEAVVPGSDISLKDVASQLDTSGMKSLQEFSIALRTEFNL